MRLLLPLLALALLSCCASPEPVPIVHAFCLPMKDYTAAEQQKAAGEIERLPAGSEIGQMIADYGDMRNADRECLKHT